MICLMAMAIMLQAQDQIYYSNHFTKKLRSMGATLIKPVEGFYKVKLLKRDQFLRYDLVLHSEEKEFEMRFCLDNKYEAGVPHVSAFATATSLASNDPHFEISINIFPPENAKSYFNASWAAYLDFIPKRSLSERHYGRLVCMYDERRGMMYNLMLFNGHDEEKNRRIYSLMFQPESEIKFPGR